ncbi:unannotated protein [freshwater metagenome]|uniref:Unannotated protein n=1 Tax=freshwater metagenome TaxID=449393 RepID=A0A6J5YJ72_9ZZZZ
MHRLEHTGPGDECSENGERERGAQQRDVPDAQHAASFLHEHRMQICGTGEPGHEGSVLDGVPGPVTTPTQNLVTPPCAEDDADSEESPCDEGPATGGKQPALSHPTSDKCSDGEGERHGETHIAEIQHRRMERHERMVLQQWVGTRAVESGWRREVAERIGRTSHQVEEEERDEQHGEQGPADEWIGQSTAELDHHRHEITAEDHRPQDDRPLKRTPECGEVVEGRGLRGPVVGDELHGEVTGNQRSFHGDEGQDTTEQHKCGIEPGKTDEIGSTTDEPVANRDGTQQGSGETERDAGTTKCNIHRVHAGASTTGTFPPSTA